MLELLILHKKKIIVGLVVLIVAVIGWSVYYSVFVMHVRSVTPEPTKLSYLTRTIKVEYNRTITSVGSVVLGEPLDVTIDDNVLVINLEIESLKPNQSYDLILNGVVSDNGQTIASETIVIRPVTGVDALSDEDIQKTLSEQQDNKSPIINDPIFRFIPYETLDYSIEAIINNAGTDFGAITLEITVNISSADSQNRSNKIKEYETAARAYLSGLDGIKLENYNVSLSIIDNS